MFCGKCSQYRRRLSLFATPDPDGINYRVSTVSTVSNVAQNNINFADLGLQYVQGVTNV